MAFELKNVVPWGRSYDEYVDMFALSEKDLSKRILGCGDGPAGFNAELTRRGGRVVSVDPLYAFSADEISRRIDETFDEVLQQTRLNQNEFVWNQIAGPNELGRIRMAAMREFLADYEQGKAENRYQPMTLPQLDFPDHAFDLCVCSHFLFLYSRQLDLDFHLTAIEELCRVAKEVRIFPLLQLGATPSPHVDPISNALIDDGYTVSQPKVPYEFQRGGNRMLEISHS